MLGNMPLVTFGFHTPDIGDGVFLAPNATLIGEVTISRGVTIMFGAVLRADRDSISVGQGSNLQDNVVIHGDPGYPAVIGEGVSVGHGSLVQLHRPFTVAMQPLEWPARVDGK